MGRSIVQLTYYSTRLPVSGGQKRIAALREGLTGFGYDVRLIEVFSWMPLLHPDDLKFDPIDDDWARRFPGEYETRVADVLLSNKRFGDVVLSKVLENKPDILWLEQPFIWPFLRERVSDWSDIRLVYSSHNVEWQVRHQLARAGSLGPFGPFRIQEIECDLVRRADLVVNVSAPDQRWCEAAGARRAVLVPNASTPPLVEDVASARRSLRAKHGLSEDTMLLLFVSAYWEPNWLGLAQWCLPALGALASRHDVRLLLVGGVGGRAAEAALPDEQERMIVRTGEVEEAEKNAAYAAADAVLLPIIAGGGTNLKSAEALLSSLPIVASGYAMRGLERFSTREGICVADDPPSFAAALEALILDHFARQAEGRPPLRRAHDPELALACDWKGALVPLEPAIAQLLQP